MSTRRSKRFQRKLRRVQKRLTAVALVAFGLFAALVVFPEVIQLRDDLNEAATVGEVEIPAAAVSAPVPVYRPMMSAGSVLNLVDIDVAGRPMVMQDLKARLNKMEDDQGTQQQEEEQAEQDIVLAEGDPASEQGVGDDSLILTEMVIGDEEFLAVWADPFPQWTKTLDELIFDDISPVSYFSPDGNPKPPMVPEPGTGLLLGLGLAGLAWKGRKRA